MSKIEEVTPARYPAETLAKISEVLAQGEPRSEFIREATEREILRRTLRNFRRKTRKTLYEKKRI
jgi:hypothetical protein